MESPVLGLFIRKLLTCSGEFTQLVSNHVLRYFYRYVVLAVVNHESKAYKGRKDGTSTSLGSDRYSLFERIRQTCRKRYDIRTYKSFRAVTWFINKWYLSRRISCTVFSMGAFWWFWGQSSGYVLISIRLERHRNLRFRWAILLQRFFPDVFVFVEFWISRKIVMIYFFRIWLFRCRLGVYEMLEGCFETTMVSYMCLVVPVRSYLLDLLDSETSSCWCLAEKEFTRGLAKS